MRRLAKQFSLFSYPDRLHIGAVERPHYGHCIYEAAKLAGRLGHREISVIEFGAGGGNGLIDAEWHIAEIEKILPVKIQLYGFDNATGLPATQDYRDFPHYFRPGQFQMDVEALRRKLQRGKLVLGEVATTCQTFFQEFKPAPVGAIFHDLDFYSSTRDSLRLFEADAAGFLPRVFMYFDDIKGDNTWLANEYAGETLAINEFNRDHATKKICLNRGMPNDYWDQYWVDQIYIYHDFEHPQYNLYVGGDESQQHDVAIKLRG